MAKEKISETAVGAPAPVVAYAGSAEAALIAPHRRVTIKSNVVGANFLPSASLYADDIDPEDAWIVESTEKEKKDEEEIPQDVRVKKSPSLMDIELVSNTVVYDASGNPSATVVFKIRNSSGEKVKSVNARVKVL
jgi:hypothetical protein